MAKRHGLVAACVALSCGGPQRAATPVDAGVTIKTYAPLAFKTDARSPGLAVILGTDATGGSSVMPLAAGGGTRRVDALVVSLATPTHTRPTLAPITVAAVPVGIAPTTASAGP